jgi:hypothetical protein
MSSLKKLEKEVDYLDKRLSLLKKGVGLFCVMIIILNFYHINRLGELSTNLSTLMGKYELTTAEILNFTEAHGKQFKHYIVTSGERTRIKYHIHNPEPFVEQFMKDTLEHLPYGDVEIFRRVMLKRLAYSEEIVEEYKLPIGNIIGDVDSPIIEQSIFSFIENFRLLFCNEG